VCNLNLRDLNYVHQCIAHFDNKCFVFTDKEGDRCIVFPDKISDNLQIVERNPVLAPQH
jgi:hypothetical protein